jgi:hypothetical protein
MQINTQHHLENRNRNRDFSVGIRWLVGGRSLHTTRSIARVFLRVVLIEKKKTSLVVMTQPA